MSLYSRTLQKGEDIVAFRACNEQNYQTLNVWCHPRRNNAKLFVSQVCGGECNTSKWSLPRRADGHISWQSQL